jgi:N-acyl homoserine lactone hydrolase
LTHAHWDHVSGLPDFPDVPVWVTPQEREFIRKGGNGQFGKPFTAYDTRSISSKTARISGKPRHLRRRLDRRVVPAPGHTPGSVIVFVKLHKGPRYAFVGDLVCQLEGITPREERSWLVRQFADLDAEGTRKNLLHMIAIKVRLPELIIVCAQSILALFAASRLD